MSDTVPLAAIAVIAGPGAGLSMAWLAGRQRRREAKDLAELRRVERLEDWDRQDKVADRVKEVAVATEVAAAVTNSKLDDVAVQAENIHTLVNSQLTAANQAELNARRALVVVLKEKAHPSPENLAMIESEETTIAELAAKVADRLKATEEVATRTQERSR